MELNKKQDLREKLLQSLKNTAQEIGLTPYFWDYFTDKLIAGEVDGIDPTNHLKHHKSLDLICEDIHKILMPDLSYKDITPETRMIYLQIVRVVNEGLSY